MIEDRQIGVKRVYIIWGLGQLGSLLHCTSQNWGESLPGFRFLVACVSKSKDREPPFFPYIGLMIADKSLPSLHHHHFLVARCDRLKLKRVFSITTFNLPFPFS